MSEVFHDAAARCKTTLTPGAIDNDTSTLDATKEHLRLDQLIPQEIISDRAKLEEFLKAYYTFMNMDEFIYQETETFNEVVLDGKVSFRIDDPNNDNNEFFTDETGDNSTLVLTAPNGTTTNIPLSAANVSITNGNELPGSLAASSSEIGKTFTVNSNPSQNQVNLASFNNHTAKLTTIVKYWVGPGPSYVMNTIEEAMDIDQNETNFLELMQKEIAATVPRNVTVNKRNLYKQITDFYKVRGSSDSIEIFFRLLFNDNVEVEFPFDSTLIPSSGNWEVDPALPNGGRYLDNKGFLSYNIKIQDSLRFQKFSYLVKTGQNLEDWRMAFNKLVHPAGFIYFAEILIFLELIDDVLGAELNKASMPGAQPGLIGPEDIPVLVEIFVSEFLPTTEAKIHKSGTLSLTLKNGVISSTTITAGGSGYVNAPTITSSDSGTPSGFTAATLTASIAAGAVSGITIGDGGKDYNVPALSIAAPAAIVFDGSSSSIVSAADDTIQLSSAQQSAFPVGSQLTYTNGGGTTIGGLTSGSTFHVVFSSGNKIKLSATSGGSPINITGVGVGNAHTLTGTTATATAAKIDGALDTLSVVEEGFGYSSAPAISFNGVALDGLSGVAPVASIAITSEGKLDIDNITITSRGQNWSNLFATAAGNTNAGKIATVTAIGRADKIYSSAPSIVFPEPTAKDTDGNLLSSNVTAVANFTLDSEGEINGVNISNAGSGYVDDPIVTLSSAVHNEQRVKDIREVIHLNLNHKPLALGETIFTVVTNPRQTNGSKQNNGNSDKRLPEHDVEVANVNFRTIEDNSYRQNRGPSNFFTSPRLFNSNQTLAFLGSNQLQTIDSTDINKYNTSTFVHIE